VWTYPIATPSLLFAAIDRLVGHLKSLVIGVGTLQPAGNLLGRPLKAEFACHELGQRSVLHQSTDLRATASNPRRLLGLAGPIAVRTIVAANLVTDRRRRAAERRRDTGSSDFPLCRARSPHARSRSTPILADAARLGVSRQTQPECGVPTSDTDQTVERSDGAFHPCASAPT